MKHLARFAAVLLSAVFFLAVTALADPFTLPANLEVIEAEAFGGCESLSGVLYIPAEVEVDATAFDHTPNLTVTRSPWRVAVIGDSGDLSEPSLNRDVWSAVSAFCQVRDIPCVYGTGLDTALSGGSNVVITVGFLAADGVEAAQTACPGVRFICLDGAVDNQQSNVYTVSYSTREAGFMAGYAPVRMGHRSLGFMGGMDLPDVVGYGQGFLQGANRAAIELNLTDAVSAAYVYTGSFMPSDSTYQTARSWYQAGTEVIFCAGGSQGESVIRAADETGGRMIGVDTDQRALYGDNVVTSAMKNLGYSATDALSRILAGAWDGIGGTSPTLGVVHAAPADNHVCLAPTTSFNSGFTAADYAAMVGKLLSGEYSTSAALEIAVSGSPAQP